MSAIDTIYTALQGIASTSVSVAFGDRQVAVTPTGLVPAPSGAVGRIVLTVGDESGSAGKFAAPRKPGRNPRPLVDWMSVVVIYVWAYVPSQQTNEQAHVSAATSLLEQVIQAVNAAAVTDFSLADITPKWVKKDVEKAAGKTIRITLPVRVPLCDETATTGDITSASGSIGMTFPQGEDEDGEPIESTEFTETITIDMENTG